MKALFRWKDEYQEYKDIPYPPPREYKLPIPVDLKGSQPFSLADPDGISGSMKTALFRVVIFPDHSFEYQEV
jgi:hypothetical protein